VHIRLIAVGERQPAWVDEAFRTYTERFPREWQFQIDVIATAKRTKKSATNEAAARAVNTEAQRVLARLRTDEQLVLLDEQGTQLGSQALAARLGDWQLDGRKLSFLIGGPDGVSADCHKRANFTWSLSKLTLPHGLARVLFAEQLYRAWSLQTGHPYHRD
jgi:23S rRNA (pseudouridine1915-N3)-methyltransferase